MAIPESQLETWAHQGSITNSANTGNAVKAALENYKNFPAVVKFQVYLQGSYKNDTNTFGESDVDVVVELTSVYYDNLTMPQKVSLGWVSAQYSLSEFKVAVEKCLREYFGTANVEAGTKVFKIKPGTSGRLHADVLVCASYFFYHDTTNALGYYSGVTFWTTSGNQIINFPKFHSLNATEKHRATAEWFKPTVRIFKNIKKTLVNNHGFTSRLAQSYFIECLTYNIPPNNFGSSYGRTIVNCLNYLHGSNLEAFKCVNGIKPLWGTTSDTWNQTDAREFINNAIRLWNEY